MFSELSKHELEVILDISYKCLAIERREAFVPVFDRLNELILFRSAAIAVQEKKQGDGIALDWINHGFSPEWTECYRDNNYEAADPVLIHAGKSDAPFTWEEARAYAGKANKKTVKFLQVAKAAGVYNGIAVSSHLKDGTGPGMIITIDTGTEKIPDHWSLILRLILPHIHEALKRIKTGKKETGNLLFDLSEREVETLKWATEGKSSWEIGQIMGISERTIKFHFSNIFSKLNVVNRAQAVAIGLSSGVI